MNPVVAIVALLLGVLELSIRFLLLLALFATIFGALYMIIECDAEDFQDYLVPYLWRQALRG